MEEDSSWFDLSQALAREAGAAAGPHPAPGMQG